MCQDRYRPLSFETLLTDPLVRLVMEADGLTPRDLIAPLAAAREAIVVRERSAIRSVLQAPSARNAPA